MASFLPSFLTAMKPHVLVSYSKIHFQHAQPKSLNSGLHISATGKDNRIFVHGDSPVAMPTFTTLNALYYTQCSQYYIHRLHYWSSLASVAGHESNWRSLMCLLWY